MRKPFAALLILIAIASVIGGLCFVVPLLRSEDHGHVLIGALYILIFAVPLLAVAMICGIGGIYLLANKPAGPPKPVADPAAVSGSGPRSWTLGQGMIWLSYLILAWAVLDALLSLPTAFITGFSMGKLVLVFLSFLDLKLVACVAAYLTGRHLMRQAQLSDPKDHPA